LLKEATEMELRISAPFGSTAATRTVDSVDAAIKILNHDYPDFHFAEVIGTAIPASSTWSAPIEEFHNSGHGEWVIVTNKKTAEFSSTCPKCRAED
jgi:hypothetical protein